MFDFLNNVIVISFKFLSGNLFLATSTFGLALFGVGVATFNKFRRLG